ncbi:MAG: 5-formyltetrahydrofolate cyclo-ligase [Ruminococcaceae bacterium]|nr:5-formyltetrahydrofolate cyclo-ligase [Oscillospiraceae bacterium]
MQIKKDVRKNLLKTRSKVTSKDEKSRKIFARLTELPEYIKARTVLCYVSVGDEAGTYDIINHSLSLGKKVAVPYCVDKCGNMEFYLINSDDELKEGMYGIPEPDINFNKRLEDFENSIIIVPGVAFNEKGYRLGYGGGYYDRYLCKFHGVSVGLCYQEMLQSSFPVEENDIPVGILITDKQTIYVNGG